jgi:REase_AHJR-like protein
LISPNPPASERQQIERIAEEYRSKGYDVQVEPSDPDLPPFLRGCQPDLIARRGDERLVIEVRTPLPKSEPDRLTELAERVQREPGWKLILIAPSPMEEILPGEQLQLLSLPEVEEQLGDARQLLGAGHQEAAILLAWAAVEGQLRELARQEEIPLPRPGTLMLLRQLVSLGLIDREQYRTLADAYKARSAVAHGFRPPSELGPAVQALLGLSEAIARESSNSQIRKEEMDAAEEFFQGEVEWPEY